MEALRKRARELLETGAVDVVIGYGAGSAPDRARAIFVRTPKQADELILDDRCSRNLAVYLMKPEVQALGRPAIVANVPALRSILQLAAESQMADGRVVAIGFNGNGTLTELPTFKAIEEYLAAIPPALTPEELARIATIEKMSMAERFAFWRSLFARCLRCYACRAACPLCYCGKCFVECNQPQWIPAIPHEESNLEWHLTRAMHLAGRCINCGDCAAACPVGIPLNVLTQMLAREVAGQFGLHAGTSSKKEYVLSTFKTDDKETFIR